MLLHHVLGRTTTRSFRRVRGLFARSPKAAPIYTPKRFRLRGLEVVENREQPGSLLALQSLPTFADVTDPAPAAVHGLTLWLSDATPAPAEGIPASDAPALMAPSADEEAEASRPAKQALADNELVGVRRPAADDLEMSWVFPGSFASIDYGGAGMASSPSPAGGGTGPDAPAAGGTVSIAPTALVQTGGTEPQFSYTSPPSRLARDGGTSSYSLQLTADNDHIYTGDEVTFAVDASDDPAPTFTQVEWDFNYDGNTFTAEASGTDQSIAHTFQGVGDYTVAARVTDQNADTQVVTTNVTVHHPAPVLTVPADFTVTQGDIVTLAVTADTDVSISKVEWSVARDNGDYENNYELQGLTPDFEFTNYGDYDFWVKVTDANGEVAEDGFKVTANNRAPDGNTFYLAPGEVQNGPVDEGSTVTFFVTNLDKEFDIKNDDSLTVEADWYGNGEWEVVDDADWNLNKDQNLLSFDFTYDDNAPGGGPWHAKIRVSDDWGTYTEDLVDVNVVNVAPAGRARTVNAPGDPGKGPARPNLHVASMETSGQEVWAVYPSTLLQIIPVTATDDSPTVGQLDPSAADEEKLDFHWVIDGKDWSPGNPANGTGDAYDAASISLKKEPFAAGTNHTVEVWMVDKDGAESKHMQFTAAVFPDDPVLPHPYVGDLGGPIDPDAGPSLPDDFTATPTSLVAGPWGPEVGYGPSYNGVYGNFTPLTYTPEATQRYADWPAMILEQSSLDAEFVFDKASKAFAAQNGATPFYRFAIDVRPEGKSAVSPTHMYIPSVTGELSIGPFPNDCMVIITAIADFRQGNTVFRSTTPHQIILHTPRSPDEPSWLDDLGDLYTLLRQVGSEFGDELVNFFATLGGGGFENILHNLQVAVPASADLFINNFGTNGTAAFMKWLTGQSGAAQQIVNNLGTVNFSNLRSVGTFLLNYSGLTWDNVQSVIMQELGAGNVAAVTTVVDDLLGSDINLNDPASLLDFVKNLGFDDNFLETMKTKVLNKITEEVARAVPMFLSRFIPGAGTIRALYDGFRWLIDNKDSLRDFFTSVKVALRSLAEAKSDQDINDSVVPAFYGAMNAAVDTLIPLVAKQFGLGKLPDELRRIIEYVPQKVDETLRNKIRKFAKDALAGAAAPAPEDTGRLTIKRDTDTKVYTAGQKSFRLIPVEVGTANPATQIKIVNITDGNKVHVLTYKDFPNDSSGTTSTGATLFKNASDAAKALRDLANGPARKTIGKGQPNATPDVAKVKVLKEKQAALDTAMGALAAYIALNGCQFLNAGCFAAGTKLWTPAGYRKVEEFKAGDLIYSRNEFDPAGPVEVKVIEEVFERFAGVYNLHVGGQVIGTSGEHPFYVEGKGWTRAFELQKGDRIATADGVGVVVEEVWDTGEWEPVYNLRVADHHTYFVGDDTWGWAAWVHNAYAFRSLNDDEVTAILEGGGISKSGRSGQKAMADLIGYNKQDTKYISATESFNIVKTMGNPQFYIKFDTSKVTYISKDELLSSSNYQQFRSYMLGRLHFVEQQKHSLVVGAIPRSAMLDIVLYGTHVDP